MLQNLFVVLGTAITTLMTGQLGDIPLAAIGLSNQLYFLLSLAQFGISSGSSIFTAQFWGNRDKENISRVLGVSNILGFLIGGFFALVALFIPRAFLQIFTNDPQVIDLGIDLLRISSLGFLFTPAINIYSFILRSTGDARMPMLVSTSGVLLNSVLGYAFIFGKLGSPAMGAQGAALANSIARIFECFLLIGMVYKLKTPLAVPFKLIFSFDQQFARRILKRVLPVTFNELMWALGISAYSAIYAHISTESIAAISIKDSVDNLAFVPFMGLTHACAILVGNTIGSREEEKSYDYVNQTIRLVLIMAVFLGGLIFAGRSAITSWYNISAQTSLYTNNLLVILGISLWIRALNVVFFIGMMRSGGDTSFAYRMDVGSMWLLGVPLALLAAFVFKMPVHFVYLTIMIEEMVKFIVSVWRYRSRRWIHDLITA